MTWQNQQNECAPSEDSDQPGHPPSLIIVFAVRMKKPWVLGYPLSAQRRLWSDWADAQADLNFRWAQSHFVGFVMSWLKWLEQGNKGNLSHLITKPTKWLRPAKTQISLGIRRVWSAQSDQVFAVRPVGSFLHADSEDWSNWADAKADLSLRWADMPFC